MRRQLYQVSVRTVTELPYASLIYAVTATRDRGINLPGTPQGNRVLRSLYPWLEASGRGCGGLERELSVWARDSQLTQGRTMTSSSRYPRRVPRPAHPI